MAKYPARRSAWVPGGKSHGSGARNLGRSPLLPPRALARLANEAQLRARIACLPGDLGPHREFLDAPGGPQHHPRPDEVVRYRRRSCAFGASRAHVIDQRRGRESECIGLAERMALQELQVSLFAPLPLRDGFECVDVPADELGKRGCTVLDAGERGRILQDDLAVFRPGACRYAMRERPGFLMDHCLVTTESYDRGIASRAIRLLVDFDVGHGELGGDMGFLSPLRRLRNR